MEQLVLQEQLRYLIDNKTKPIGALGRLEEIAFTAGVIQGTTRPAIVNPHIVVFAGDHGIAATGLVNPYPQEVTAQMVLNFIRGGAAINVFCRQYNIELIIVDAGVNHHFDSVSHDRFIKSKMAPGTNNYMSAPAMTVDFAEAAINRGKQIVSNIAKETGCNCIGLGEMGIGNTSSAALIMSAVMQLPPEACVGRGTGTDDRQLQIKINTLRTVSAFHELEKCHDNAIQLLSKIGGFEIAMLAGAYLQAANEHMVIVVDGFISTAALLLARLLNPDIAKQCIFAHTSGEKGHQLMLDYLDVKPLLNLEMRLGEGSGAALAIPLIQSAVNFLNEMSSFEHAGVTNKV